MWRPERGSVTELLLVFTPADPLELDVPPSVLMVFDSKGL